MLRAIIILYLSAHLNASGQVTLTDSNLPIVLINTDGNVTIPNAPRIRANMKIIYKGSGVRNAVADQDDPTALNYNGRIEIEVRGSTSALLEKKPYSLTTLLPDNISNNNVSLLEMPKENDWVLNNFAFEPSLIRDHISFALSRAIGEYAPRTVFCEVIVNGNYRGVYLLQEKIKIDDNRVDVTKIDADDIAFPDVTGGYIIKADKVTGEDPSAWKMASYSGSTPDFIFESPKPSAIKYQQANYIIAQFFSLQGTVTNTSAVNGYPSIIDVPSFVNFMLINELSANVDAYQYSTFFHKDKRGKLRAGPLWDLNLSYGNDLFQFGFDRSKTNTWQFDNGDNVGAKFWRDLYNDPTFRCYLSKRWNALTQVGQPLDINSINALIDETVARINEAMLRENARWNRVGDHTAHINAIKNFLTARMNWMTTALGSFSACGNVTTPPLVISRIMYDPATSSQFPSSSEQEFIEITNNGNSSIDMTGIYFSGTGFVYQFPPGYIFPAQGVLQLANEPETFEKRYAISPFGEFTRSLSNNGQKITLADAWGNAIDEVAYSSQSPWPNASANGFHIKLKDLSLDNNLASSWVASNEPLSTNVIASITNENRIEIFPNPAEDYLRVNSGEGILSVQLTDSMGRLLKRVSGHFNEITFPIGDHAPGMYLVSIRTNSGVTVKRIQKVN